MKKIKLEDEKECILKLNGSNTFQMRQQGCDLDCDNCGFYKLKKLTNKLKK